MKYVGKNRAYVCYEGEDAQLMKKLDDLIFEIVEKFNPNEYCIPALIDNEVLRKCGSFQSFPQHITYCAVNRDKQNVVMDSDDSNLLKNSGYSLTPAACLHLYPMLEGKEIKEQCLTTKAKVYRYEDMKFDGFARFWDFTVREIVFVGNKDYVINSIDLLCGQILDLAKEIGIDVDLRDAADAFFPSTRNILKMKMQLQNKLKKEFITVIEGKEVAIGSVNYHGNHFSKPFNFDNNNTVVSACIGVGLERWLSAIDYRKMRQKIIDR